MMGLADDLDTIRPSRRANAGEPGLVERILAALDDTDRAALEKKLRDTTCPATRLAQMLTDNGHPISHSTISSWRVKHVAG